MNEIEMKKQDKFLEENKYKLIDILNFINNKDKVVREEFIVKDLKTINRLGDLLNKMYTDKVLRFTDLEDHNTIFKIKNKENLLITLHEFISSFFEDNYKVTIDTFMIPACLSFSSENSDKVYYLMNYDTGTIII